MKLQGLSLLFVVIVLPILLMVSYTISLQIDTINMQSSYNTKLIDSTKEAIDAFEINTIEWNANYSETADSKRRNVMASITTFTNSLANNFGVAGTSRDYMMARIPAIAYTLYDGYYIYSPAETSAVIKDKDNGVAKQMTEKLYESREENGLKKITGYVYKPEDEGKILYKTSGTKKDGYFEGQAFTLNPDEAEKKTEHILKPFTAYSEQLTNDIVINYTLDNYITIYGKVEDADGTTEHVSKSGYLTDPEKIEMNPSKLTAITADGGIKGVKFEGNLIKPEKLEEQISYTDDEVKYEVGSFNYVYESEGNTKVYYDAIEQEFFQLDSNSKRIFMSDLPTELYKKCTVPIKNNESGDPTYVKFYQSLENTSGEWFRKDIHGNILESTVNSSDLGLTNDILDDYSAINYYVESYFFTDWVNKKVVGEKNSLNFLKISADNDPDPATSQGSAFETHKREVIKSVVESNLKQAIISYNQIGSENFYLPALSETDWDQILRNTSIIAFIQNIPIGVKYYNDYAIATSTVNKEYVDPNEIYLNASDGDARYYHMPYCSSLGETNLIGFRSIDYVQKSYTEDTSAQTLKTKRYYKHNDNTGIGIDVEEACYGCIVQKALYEKSSVTVNKQKAYFTALARERYIARIAKLPAQVPSEAHIYVETFDTTEGKTITNANFEVGIHPDYTKDEDTKIPKNIPNGTKYTVKAVIDETTVEDANTVTDFSKIYPTTNAMPSKNSAYESDSKAEITIISYEDNSIKYLVDTKGTNTQWGGAHNKMTGYGNNRTELSLDSDAYINIRLNYKRNYTSNAGHIESVWANIDKYNQLTIATRIKGITGKIRLTFTNDSGTTLYSNDVFNIPNENAHEIYCSIPKELNNIDWYNYEWKVSAIAVDNSHIAGPETVDFYTIKDKTGFTDFAEAVNGRKGNSAGAKTVNRKFYLIADIDMQNNKMKPIAENSDVKWFDGYFSGGHDIKNGKPAERSQPDHTISNVTIETTNSKENKYAYGLFGWVGKPGQIESIQINNININHTGTVADTKIGGLAGFCDTGSTIQKINVNGGSIKSNVANFVGGLIGSTYRAIDSCTVNGLSSISGTRYVGGIVGKTSNTVTGCTTDGGTNKVTKITGTGDSGGIAGQALAPISGSYAKNIAEIKGEQSTGGIVGYTEKSVSNSHTTNVTTITGFGNMRRNSWICWNYRSYTF